MCKINAVTVKGLRGDTLYNNVANSLVLDKLRTWAKDSHVLLSSNLWEKWDQERNPSHVCRTWLIGTPPARHSKVYVAPDTSVLHLVEPFDKTWWVLGDLELLHNLKYRIDTHHVLSL
jgi:hypothetical protein